MSLLWCAKMACRGKDVKSWVCLMAFVNKSHTHMLTHTQCLSDYTTYCWSLLCESLPLANTFIIEYFFIVKKNVPTIYKNAQKMVIPRVKKSTLLLSLKLQYMNECVRCQPTLAVRQLQLGVYALTVGVAGATRARVKSRPNTRAERSYQSIVFGCSSTTDCLPRQKDANNNCTWIL